VNRLPRKRFWTLPISDLATALGEPGFDAKDIANANISTGHRYDRDLPVGAGEAIVLKNQRRQK